MFDYPRASFEDVIQQLPVTQLVSTVAAYDLLDVDRLTEQETNAVKARIQLIRDELYRRTFKMYSDISVEVKTDENWSWG